MPPTFEFNVTITVERLQGKFAGNDELEEMLTEALDEANPSSLDTSNDAEYEVTDWEITPIPRSKKPRAKKV